MSDIQEKALAHLQQYSVLMLNGHFDFGNGYHGRVYLNPHQLFRYPSRIWRLAQDLLEVLPASVRGSTEVVVGPAIGGALLAHTVAGLLDSRREITKPDTLFAPFHLDQSGSLTLPRFYSEQLRDRQVLIVGDVRNTGQTLAHCAGLVRAAGGVVLATAEIYDRMEAIVDAGVPNYALAEYRAPENYRAEECPMCRQGVAVSRF